MKNNGRLEKQTNQNVMDNFIGFNRQVDSLQLAVGKKKERIANCQLPTADLYHTGKMYFTLSRAFGIIKNLFHIHKTSLQNQPHPHPRFSPGLYSLVR